MTIKFEAYDKVNILVHKDEYHLATIRNLLKGIQVDIDDSVTIEDLEQILSKMKELQWESNANRT